MLNSHLGGNLAMMRILSPFERHIFSPRFFSKIAVPKQDFKFSSQFSSFSIRRSSSKRLKSQYTENKSPALRLDVSTAELDKASKDSKQLVNISENYIKEHAARRVDLFFYTMVAYYKSHLFPVRRRTDLQHGVGRSSFDGKNVTQACHSSFFGGFADQAHSQSGLLDGTYLQHALNATVELPGFVNKMDDALEERFEGRAESLKILQAVASEKISPTDGLALFLQLMEKLFAQIEKNGSDNQVYPSQYVKADVLALQRFGTFTNKWRTDRRVVNDDYIEMLLRLTPEEKATCKISNKMREECYRKKYSEIKNEIISAEPVTAKI
jgi:hypothetical protein